VTKQFALCLFARILNTASKKTFSSAADVLEEISGKIIISNEARKNVLFTNFHRFLKMMNEFYDLLD